MKDKLVHAWQKCTQGYSALQLFASRPLLKPAYRIEGLRQLNVRGSFLAQEVENPHGSAEIEVWGSAPHKSNPHPSLIFQHRTLRLYMSEGLFTLTRSSSSTQYDSLHFHRISSRRTRVTLFSSIGNDTFSTRLHWYHFFSKGKVRKIEDHITRIVNQANRIIEDRYDTSTPRRLPTPRHTTSDHSGHQTIAAAFNRTPLIQD